MATQYPPDDRPYVCIPYWTSPIGPDGRWDTGTVRPLPSAVTSYLCESIHPGPYIPGQPLDVVVEVRNSGGGNAAALATVVVYWAVPTAGFANPTWLAMTDVAVPTGRTAPSTVATATMTGVIPATAPDHVCLLVAVTHNQDRAGSVCDPIHDRHWAQRNLQAVRTAVGARALVPVMAANPLLTAGTFDLRIRPAGQQQALQVARAVGAQPVNVPLTTQLIGDDGAPVPIDQQGVHAVVQLGALGQRRYQLLVQPGAQIPAGGCAVLEAGLYHLDDGGSLVGSLGVAVLPAR